MILTIDLGNTNIVFGLFKGNRLIRQWRRPSDRYKKIPHNFKCEGVVVASVVPVLDAPLRTEIKKRLGANPHFVTGKNIRGLKIRIRNKSEVGADRLVDALAAYKLYGGPCLVVDFGTATTFDVISKKGEYLGGIIAPGVVLGRDALYERTAKLPKVSISAPRSLVGKNTVSAMQSGLVYGYVAMVEGMVERIKSQIPSYKSQIKVIATGGLAKLICKYTKVVDRIDTTLTLKGLKMVADDLGLGRKNVGRTKRAA